MANFNKIVIVTLLACIVGKVYAAATVQGLSGSVPIKGAELTTLITAYSEKSSQTGMKPAGYPMKVKAPDNDNTRAWGIAGQTITVYPGAVHQKHYGSYMWGVVRVWCKDTNKFIYVHIIDMCDAGDRSCQKNISPYNFLVDLHSRAWGAIGDSSGNIMSEGKISYLFKLDSDTLINKYGKIDYMLNWLNCWCDKESCNPDSLGSGPYWCPKGKCYLRDSCA